ncbi:MAG: hypothetical protein HC872_00130 [Gammaproteobacteria bacterium]|nr:hypothetical protein [Gammaproteobacteria bacterium]
MTMLFIGITFNLNSLTICAQLYGPCTPHKTQVKAEAAGIEQQYGANTSHISEYCIQLLKRV